MQSPAIPPSERLTEDDRATAASEQFLARALADQQRRAQQQGRKPPHVPGLCRNCFEPCGRRIWCDADCRFDEALRLKAARLAGRGLAP